MFGLQKGKSNALSKIFWITKTGVLVALTFTAGIFYPTIKCFHRCNKNKLLINYKYIFICKYINAL